MAVSWLIDIYLPLFVCLDGRGGQLSRLDPVNVPGTRGNSSEGEGRSTSYPHLYIVFSSPSVFFFLLLFLFFLFYFLLLFFFFLFFFFFFFFLFFFLFFYFFFFFYFYLFFFCLLHEDPWGLGDYTRDYRRPPSNHTFARSHAEGDGDGDGKKERATVARWMDCVVPVRTMMLLYTSLTAVLCCAVL